MKEDLTWRLKELPTAEGVATMVANAIITPEEAREILFKKRTNSTEEIDALNEQIHFLQAIVKSLSQRPTLSPYLGYSFTATTAPKYWANTVTCLNKGMGAISLSSTAAGNGNTKYTMSSTNSSNFIK